jgi:large subunit ribosomal protein L29
MKASDLRLKSINELHMCQLELVKEQFNLFMQKATGQLAKPDQIRRVRKDIARVCTLITEKEKAK